MQNPHTIKRPLLAQDVAAEVWYAGTDREIRSRAPCDAGARPRSVSACCNCLQAQGHLSECELTLSSSERATACHPGRAAPLSILRPTARPARLHAQVSPTPGVTTSTWEASHLGST